MNVLALRFAILQPQCFVEPEQRAKVIALVHEPIAGADTQMHQLPPAFFRFSLGLPPQNGFGSLGLADSHIRAKKRDDTHRNHKKRES